jgi:hypothetical protein
MHTILLKNWAFLIILYRIEEMKKIVCLLTIFLMNFNVFATEGVFMAPSLGLTYASSSSESLASQMGLHVGVIGGFRRGNLALELGIARSRVTNQAIGSNNYETELENDLYFGGLRLFTGEFLSFAAGFMSHNLKATINNNSSDIDGSYLSFYGSMGVNFNLNKYKDLYWEGTFSPVSEADIYYVQFAAGLRFYL